MTQAIEELETVVRAYMTMQRMSELVGVGLSSHELSEKELSLIRGLFLLGCLDFLRQSMSEEVSQQDVVTLLRLFLSDESYFPEGGSTSLLDAILEASSHPTLALDIRDYGSQSVASSMTTKGAGNNAFGLLLQDDARMERILSVLRDEPRDTSDSVSKISKSLIQDRSTTIQQKGGDGGRSKRVSTTSGRSPGRSQICHNPEVKLPWTGRNAVGHRRLILESKHTP